MTLPSGTVTFLFTDIQGSTPLWERMPVAMQAALVQHNAILQDAVQENGGVVFKFIGDEFQCAFSQPESALNAALSAQRGLAQADWGETGAIRVRMGLHSGPAEVQGSDYATSHTLNRVARIRSAGHGGQLLLSLATAELLRGQLPADVQLLNLGEYHLKGMLQAERIFQVSAPDLAQEFPPLAAEKSATHNLPLQLTSFIGREVEIAQVQELLRTSRLVTLTGSGGVGKTRLALRIAEYYCSRINEAEPPFKHGVWLVELAPLGDGTLIPRLIASVFGLQETMGRSLRDVVVDYLAEKQLLLILDNCEHLIAGCADLADDLLHHCPTLSLLASSREALGIEGETPFYVPSLVTPDPAALPPLADLQQIAAVELFVQRARQASPSFTLTEQNALSLAQICRRLDGIPLAIELAAARVRVLSLEQIAARLDDRFRLLTGGSRRALPRHQTLHALIDWSYSLLPDAERRLLRSLSAFAGGWTLEAAEDVCASIDEGDVLDLLSQLVNKSLVQIDAAEGEVYRYRMLETIRQYAQEKLLDAGEAEALRDRHLDYFRRLVQTIAPDMLTERLADRLEQLDSELDNLRLALGWAFAASDETRVANGLQLACALREFWQMRSLAIEGSDWLMKGLRLLPQDALLEKVQTGMYSHADMLFTIGSLEMSTFDFSRLAEARQMLEAGIAAYEKLGDRLGIARAMCLLGVCLLEHYALSSRTNMPHAEFQHASQTGAKGLAVCREIGSPDDLAFALHWNGLINSYGLDSVRARRYLAEALALYEKQNNRLQMGYLLATLGFIALSHGDLAAVRQYAHKGMQQAETLKDKVAFYTASSLLGLAAYYEGDFTRMAAEFQATHAIGKATGNPTWRMFSLRNLGIAALHHGAWAQAAAYFQEQLSLARKFSGYNYDLQVFLPCMAGVALGLGKLELSARLLGTSEALFASFFKPLDAWDQAEFERIAAETRQGMSEASFAAAWAEGSALTLEQATREAEQVVEG